MKVAELIACLERMDPDQEVQFSYNYGDYGRTTVAEDIREVNEADVEWSEYHSMNRVLDADDDREDECRDPSKPLTSVVLLS